MSAQSVVDDDEGVRKGCPLAGACATCDQPRGWWRACNSFIRSRRRGCRSASSDVGVAEQELHHAQVRAVVDQMRRERVAKHVGEKLAGGIPACAHVALHDRPERLSGQRAAARSRGTARRSRGAFRRVRREPTRDSARSSRSLPRRAARGAPWCPCRGCARRPCRGTLRHLEADELRNTQPGRVERLEHRAIAQARAAFSTSGAASSASTSASESVSEAAAEVRQHAHAQRSVSCRRRKSALRGPGGAEQRRGTTRAGARKTLHVAFAFRADLRREPGIDVDALRRVERARRGPRARPPTASGRGGSSRATSRRAHPAATPGRRTRRSAPRLSPSPSFSPFARHSRAEPVALVLEQPAFDRERIAGFRIHEPAERAPAADHAMTRDRPARSDPRRRRRRRRAGRCAARARPRRRSAIRRRGSSPARRARAAGTRCRACASGSVNAKLRIGEIALGSARPRARASASVGACARSARRQVLDRRDDAVAGADAQHGTGQAYLGRIGAALVVAHRTIFYHNCRAPCIRGTPSATHCL